jgi:hypothetical protein
LFDDELWLGCQFRFRRPLTGRRAQHAYGGGMRPRRDDPRVMMRGLYWSAENDNGPPM